MPRRATRPASEANPRRAASRRPRRRRAADPERRRPARRVAPRGPQARGARAPRRLRERGEEERLENTEGDVRQRRGEPARARPPWRAAARPPPGGPRTQKAARSVERPVERGLEDEREREDRAPVDRALPGQDRERERGAGRRLAGEAPRDGSSRLRTKRRRASSPQNDSAACWSVCAYCVHRTWPGQTARKSAAATPAPDRTRRQREQPR